jgi:uncharacterized protein YuzE
MRISYDPQYNLLYIKLGETEKVMCKKVDEDITFDVDESGKLVGIEVLAASEHINLAALLPIEIKREAVK